jgi:hypothetical protein
MKITREGRAIPYLPLLSPSVGVPSGATPGTDCCDPTTPPDRAAEDGATVIGVTDPGVAALVQTKSAIAQNSVTFDDPVTEGNLIVLAAWARNNQTVDTYPSGFAQVQSRVVTGGFGEDSFVLYYKIATGSEGELIVDWSAGEGDDITFASEWSGIAALEDSDSATGLSTTAASGSVTATSADALIVAALCQTGIDTFRSMSPGAGYSELLDVQLDDPGDEHHPNAVFIYRLADPASGAYTPTATCDNVDWGGISAAFGYSTANPAWNRALPAANDGSDATYDLIAGADVARADLGAAFRIQTSRVRLGTATSGSRTYVIKGANVADFSDEVTLASVTFTATGSYTAQDVTFTWATEESYRYFELSGNNETRRLFAWELRELASQTILVTDPTTSTTVELQTALDNIAAASVSHVGCYVITTGTTSCTSGSFTSVAFASEINDTHAFHDNSTNNTRCTVPSGQAGYYLLAGGGEWDTNTTGERVLVLKLNGTGAEYGWVRADVGANANQFSQEVVSGAVYLSVGDYIELRAYQNSGGNRTIGGANNRTWLSLTRVGS